MLKKIFSIVFIFCISHYTLAATIENSPLLITIEQNTQIANESEINVVIKNTTDKLVKILKWNTPFEKDIKANIFKVLKNKKNVPYIGVMIKRGKPTENDYLILNPNEQKSVSIDLAQYYKMDTTGHYRVSYKGIFKYASIKQNKARSLKKKKMKFYKPKEKFIEVFYHPKKQKNYLIKLPTNFDQCNENAKQGIIDAHNAAINIAQTALIDLQNAHVPTSASRYQTWFGAPNTNRQNIVTTSFRNIVDAVDNQQMIFSCECKAGDYNTFAFVYPNIPYTIHLCPAFFRARLIGTDSKAGTIVHETSHFTIVAGTNDHVYGHEDAKNLAISNPTNAINNADSYEYFAENTPFLPMNNEIAPVDPFENATNIILQQGITSQISDSLVSNKPNYYGVEVANNLSLLEVWTESNFDTEGSVFGNDKVLIAKDSDGGTDNNFHIFQLVGVGKKYIVVEGYEGSSGNYNIYFKYNNPQYDEIILNSSNTTHNIQANFIDNKKYYLVLLNIQQSGYVELTSQGTLDTKAFLYNNNFILTNNDDDSGKNFNFLIKTVLQRGTYYLFVNDYNGNNGEFYINVKYTPRATDTSLSPAIINYLLN